MAEASKDGPLQTASVFYGSVHPVGHGLTFDRHATVQLDDDRTLEFSISTGRFIAVVSGQVPEDRSSFLNQLLGVMQGVVDSYTFHTGQSFWLEFQAGYLSPNAAVFPDRGGWYRGIGANHPVTRVEAAVLDRFASVAIQQPLIRFALADVAMAIRLPADSGYLSYRAIESIRQWYQLQDPPTDDRALGWKRLRHDTGLDREAVEQVAALARARRHGDVHPITADERAEAIRVARVAIGRVVDKLSPP